MLGGLGNISVFRCRWCCFWAFMLQYDSWFCYPHPLILFFWIKEKQTYNLFYKSLGFYRIITCFSLLVHKNKIVTQLGTEMLELSGMIIEFIQWYIWVYITYFKDILITYISYHSENISSLYVPPCRLIMAISLFIFKALSFFFTVNSNYISIFISILSLMSVAPAMFLVGSCKNTFFLVK